MLKKILLFTITTLIMLFFNCLLNVYPVMLQRYNRIRLQELIQQRSKAKE